MRAVMMKAASSETKRLVMARGARSLRRDTHANNAAKRMHEDSTRLGEGNRVTWHLVRSRFSPHVRQPKRTHHRRYRLLRQGLLARRAAPLQAAPVGRLLAR